MCGYLMLCVSLARFPNKRNGSASNTVTLAEGTMEYRLAHIVKYLAGGFYALVWAFLGDNDYFPSFFGTARTSETNPCSWCPATTRAAGGEWWTDFRSNPLASWFHRIHLSRAWLALNPVRHPLLMLPGVSIMTLAPDWMHIKYLGTDKSVYGSILYILCFVLLHEGDPPLFFLYPGHSSGLLSYQYYLCIRVILFIHQGYYRRCTHQGYTTHVSVCTVAPHVWGIQAARNRTWNSCGQ
jgi:hypothetical protein